MAKVRLGDIATVVTKGTTPTTIGFQFEDSGINFVKIESISEDGTFLKEKFSHISDECNVQMRRSQLQENDILFSIAGAIGRSAIVTKEILPANTNQALAIIRVPKGKIDYNYLLYALSSSAINQQATQHQQGVAQLNISLKNVSDFLLPIYTEAMQKRIVHNLKKIDKLISLRKQQLAKLDELVKARFVEMFGDSVANTKNFPSTTLETVMTVFPQNGLYKPQTDYVQDDTGIPILRIDAFYNGKVTNWNTLKRLICSETEIDRYLLKENDIVINRVNSIEYLGKCAHIVGLKEKTVFESNMMRFHMDEKKVNAVYVTEVLCTEDIYRQILRRAKKSVNQASINQEDVKSLEILVPPLSLQNQFAAFVERVDKQKQTVQQSLEKLELMKKALMQEYFG